MADAAQPIVLDDLTTPRLSEFQRRALDYAESAPADLDITRIVEEAVASAGVDDLDDHDGFGQRLAAYVGAVEADEGLTQLARRTVRARVVRLVRNRLTLVDLLKRYPQITSIPIEKPIIVVGMPRSGTTHLVNLLAADARRRSLPYWESQEPMPLPGQAPGPDGLDVRYRQAKEQHDALQNSSPLLAAMHDRYPEAIEEEVELLDLDCASYILEWYARVPGWRDFYLALDQRQHHAYLRKVLQALTFLRGPRTWVLKSPQHSEQLDALMATFPDATVAFTHRDPVAVIQSTITMMAYSDRLRRRSIEPAWLLEYWTDRVHRLLTASVRDRDLVPAQRRIDIGFHHLNGNEMPLLEQLYDRAGTELTADARARFHAYLDGNPRGKHGRIRYDLRGHFGVSAAELRARFDFYFDAHDVRVEDSDA
ncbi:sulfotransferase family protein [Nocardia farcinica]|uniref:Sulfotransferase n=1 Tax=Nocardia farcinica (strain IFM 10152) TaxID=247156 RepID=Q5YU98_NOCFA|nr:sulfotransferase [Nocardia farcinica]BAD58243.1 hypothetical protein NFA_33960 [Nocardia farcinica IFM 10152]